MTGRYRLFDIDLKGWGSFRHDVIYDLWLSRPPSETCTSYELLFFLSDSGLDFGTCIMFFWLILKKKLMIRRIHIH
jgi:hypothetical protein